MTGHAERPYSIEVQIDEPYREALSEAWLRGLVEAVLRAEGRLCGQL
ncbi:MAG: hypothetical protein H5T66_10530, partial [Chloroflexi bacterium]|nr:hypothetical protein [Chloroflexota bacterium]